ncbi:MAG: DUF1501 domain-containing protein [Saprospirales bacterium]|nr:DUF1501 domain-containing protein [Saprospirales bacterium]MBK6903342.1 DUF1501 domain-containing protein [Saprospirales bacterium]
MKRRSFIKHLGLGVGGPIILNGLGLSALAKSRLFASIADDTDRVLVLIQLNGGNDGLSTLVPLDQYDNLVTVRGNILIDEDDLLPLTGTLGLHPKLGGLKELFDQGKMGIVQNVGYPNQNRSHFRSVDIWTSGSPANEYWTTGWVGRYLDQQYPGYPDGYPNTDNPDPFAITMGYLVSETCQGTASNFAITLSDPFTLNNLAEWNTDEYAGTQFGEELAFVRESIQLTNLYSVRIHAAANNGNSLVEYPSTDLASQLKNIALLISGGLKTKIYTVSLGGFDTHSDQTVEDHPKQGKHSELLETLSGAIKAFQDDLVALGVEDRVMGMTFSEFGRQIRSNGSFGTDHGTAAPLILFGACMGNIILGDNPVIAEDVSVQEGVAMQYDFRDVYGSVLMDWFEMPKSQVKNILYEGFQHIPITTCVPPDATKERPFGSPIELKNFPNPFSSSTTIRFSSAGENIRLSVFNGIGHELTVLAQGKYDAGVHEVNFETGDLSSGNYYIHLKTESGSKTEKMIKAR